MKSILFGHGRKHRILKSIDYNSSIFIDKDPKCQPDLVIDLLEDQFSDYVTHYVSYFDEAIIVCCANMIMLRHGKLNMNLTLNIAKCLKVGGNFFIRNLYYRSPKPHDKEYEKCIVKLVGEIESQANFRYRGLVERLDIQRGYMLVFEKI